MRTTMSQYRFYPKEEIKTEVIKVQKNKNELNQSNNSNENESRDKLLSGDMPELHWWPDEVNQDHKYTKTYKSFSGADLMVTINGEVVGELCDLTWEEDFFADSTHDYPITGVAIFAIFNYELPLYELAKQKKTFNISMTYADEYGNQMSYRIYNCLLTKRSGKHGLDDVTISEKYYFKAKKIEKLTEKQMKQQMVLY